MSIQAQVSDAFRYQRSQRTAFRAGRAAARRDRLRPLRTALHDAGQLCPAVDHVWLQESQFHGDGALGKAT